MKPRPSTRSGHRLFFWTVGLVTALLAVSCAPAAPTESALPEEPISSVDLAPVTETAAPESEPTAVAALPDPTELPPFTPHGDQLVATDPTTVSLASGGLQLVEFFRFT